MSYPVIGVLGGMGPAATANLYCKLIEATPADRDQDHLHVVIWADPSVPDRTAALLAGGTDPTPKLIEGARQLESVGVDIVAVPCNTAHAMLPAVAAAINTPIVDMIDATVRVIQCHEPALRKVAVLATEGTMRARLYVERLHRAGLEPIEPSPEVQDGLTALIRSVKAGRGGAELDEALADLVESVAHLGADVAVAGCTELSLLLPSGVREIRGIPVVDSVSALADSVVRAALELRRNPDRAAAQIEPLIRPKVANTDRDDEVACPC